MICKAILIINCTALPINTYDYKIVNRAIKVCKDQYGPRSPCVSRFMKLGKQSYSVLCGFRSTTKNTSIITTKEATKATNKRECNIRK